MELRPRSNNAPGQKQRNPPGGSPFCRRLRCSLLSDPYRVCSSLASRLRQKCLAANVSVFVKQTT